MSGWVTDLAVQAAGRVADDLSVWSWLFERLGFDPCHPALVKHRVLPGVMRGCDLNDRAWQVTGLPPDLAKREDRAVVTLPVFVLDQAVEIYALDPFDPAYHRHLTDLVPVLPVGTGGEFFPMEPKIRLHGSLLDWLKAVSLDLIDGKAMDLHDTGRVWVGDWRSIDAMPICDAISTGKTAAVFDNDRQARAIHDLLRPPRPKLKLEIAA